jgi:hypothetical protein
MTKTGTACLGLTLFLRSGDWRLRNRNRPNCGYFTSVTVPVSVTEPVTSP